MGGKGVVGVFTCFLRPALLERLRAGVEVVSLRRCRWRHTGWQLVSSWRTVLTSTSLFVSCDRFQHLVKRGGAGGTRPVRNGRIVGEDSVVLRVPVSYDGVCFSDT